MEGTLSEFSCPGNGFCLCYPWEACTTSEEALGEWSQQTYGGNALALWNESWKVWSTHGRTNSRSYSICGSTGSCVGVWPWVTQWVVLLVANRWVSRFFCFSVSYFVFDLLCRAELVFQREDWWFRDRSGREHSLRARIPACTPAFVHTAEFFRPRTEFCYRRRPTPRSCGAHLRRYSGQPAIYTLRIGGQVLLAQRCLAGSRLVLRWIGDAS